MINVGSTRKQYSPQEQANQIKTGAKGNSLREGAVRDELGLRGEDERNKDSFTYVAGQTLKGGAKGFAKVTLATLTVGLSSALALDALSTPEGTHLNTKELNENREKSNDEISSGVVGIGNFALATLSGAAAAAAGLSILPAVAGVAMFVGGCFAVREGKKAYEEANLDIAAAKSSVGPIADDVKDVLQADQEWLMS